MSKWRRLRQRTPSFGGAMSESYLCVDCGFDTHPGTLTRAEAEKDAARQITAGKETGPKRYASIAELRHTSFTIIYGRPRMEPWGGCLCIGCLERRIGRPLIRDDFAEHVFNTYYPGTPRLLERQGRYDPLGDWEAA